MGDNLNGLFEFIYKAENGGKVDYDVVFGGIARQNRPPAPVTQMTVGEVLDWQRSIRGRQASSAAGALQIIESTLREEVNKGTVSPDDLFDEETQNRLTESRLKFRGLDKWQAGTMTPEQFGTSVAKEWASLPVLTNTYNHKGVPISAGNAYYGGVGPNPHKAFVKPQDFASVLGNPSAEFISSQNSGTRRSGDHHIGRSGSDNFYGGDTHLRMARQGYGPELEPTRHMEPWKQPDYRPDPHGTGAGAAGAPSGIEGPQIPEVDYQTRTGAGGGPMLHPGWGQAFKDVASDSFIVRGIQDRLQAADHEWDRDFDPIEQAVNDGFEGSWRYFSEARSKAHYDVLVRNYEAEQKRKRREAINPYLSADLVGSILNPDTIATLALPSGLAVSASRRAGSNALRSATSTGALAGLSETAIESGRRQFDPLASYEDSLIRVGGTMVLGGILGGAIGGFATKAARERLVRGVMQDIAREKGVFTVTDTIDLGGGRTAAVRIGRIPDNAPATAKRSGVRYVDGEVIVDDQIILRRFSEGDHRTDARTPNELMEYEVAAAASRLRQTHEAFSRFFTSESGALGPDDAGPLYRFNDDGTVVVDEPKVRQLYDEGKPIKVGPDQDLPSGVKPLRVDSRLLENADEAVRVVREAAAAAAKARGQGEFEMNLAGILRTPEGNLGARLDGPERARRAQIDEQARLDAAEALEAYRAKNNKILQNTKLEAMARLTDGPYKRIHRNGLTSEVRDLVDKLAADGAFLRGSDATGLNVGPSVYSRARTWNGVVDTLYRKETAAYEKYLGFKTNQSVMGIPVNKTVDAMSRRRGDGTRSMGIKEFRHRATSAHITGKPDPVPEVNEMAEAIKGAYGEYRQVAERYGVLRSEEILNARIERLQEEIDNALDNLETVPAWRHDELARLQKERDIAKQEPNEDYFTRIFNHHQIKENRDLFKDRIVKPWMRQQPTAQYWKAGKSEIEPVLNDLKRNGTPDQVAKLQRQYDEAPDKSEWVTEQFDMSDAAIDKRADKLIETILEEAEPNDLATLRDPRRPTFGRTRQFNIPNSMLLKDGPNGNGIADFIETDYMLVQKVYAERMGPAVEMARSFGRPVDGVDAWRGLDEAVASARRAEGKAWSEKQMKDPKQAERVDRARADAAGQRRREIETADVRLEKADEEYTAARRAFASAKEKERIAKMTEDEQNAWVADTDTRALVNWERKIARNPIENPRQEAAAKKKYLKAARDNAFAKVEAVRALPSRVRGEVEQANDYLRRASAERKAALRDSNLSKSDAESDIRAAADAVEPMDVLEGFDSHWNPIEVDLIQLRDRVTNRVVRQPDRWDNRAATGLRNWSHLAFMGLSALATIPELGMLITRHGMRRTFQAAIGGLDDATRAAFRGGVEEMQKAGAIMDVVNGAALSRFAETGVDAIQGSRMESLLRAGANRYFMFNGLAPITARLKEMDAALRVHDMVDRINRVHMMGEGAAKADLEELGRWGISRKDAEAMAREPIMETPEGHWLAQTDHWGDEELVRKFRAAIAQGNENTILMATAADKPTIVDGVVWIKRGPLVDKYARRAGLEEEAGHWRIQFGMMTLPFTFWSYGIAATNKIMIAGLDEPSAQRLAGVAAMVGLGYITASLRTPDYIWNGMSVDQRLMEGIDRSGVVGVLSNMKGIAEQNGVGNTVARAAGAGPSAARNLIEGAATGDARQFSRGLPLQNHIILGDLFDAAVDGIERRNAGLD